VDARELPAAIEASFEADEVIEHGRALVRAASVNPPGDTSEVIGVVEKMLEPLGFERLRKFEPEKGIVSLVGEWGDRGGRSLVWNGHIDVVPTGEESSWSHHPFAGDVDDGRLYGRGICDMKGGLAALLSAVSTLQRARLEPSGKLMVQAVADEETLGPLGTAHVLEADDTHADAAICGEPTSLVPVVAAKGLQWWEVTVLGRSCHASTPELGYNAIDGMADVLVALRNLDLTAEHPLVGHPTLSVGTIEGGTKINTVADRATITADRRMIPGEDPGAVEASLHEAIARSGITDPKARIEARVIQRAEPSEIAAQDEVVSAACRASEIVLGRAVEPAGMAGTTDARFLINARSIPTVIWGPGNIEQAHTVDEYVEIDQLQRAAKAYALMLTDFLGVR